jgi:pyruvyltransferase
MKKVNLIYFKDGSEYGNFGDELSKFITLKLLNKNNYKLVFNEKNCDINIVCIGSYLHKAVNNSYVYGSGVRTNPPIEGGYSFTNLHVSAVRGPLTKSFLESKGIICSDIMGDPGLLISRFYKPKLISDLTNKIGIIPHKSNFKLYKNKKLKYYFHLINPTDKWENVINSIYSCKYIISSSLHGLICSDSFNKPNVWLDEYKISEGDFKFKDYFQSQNREYIKIDSIDKYHKKLLYTGGNKIDLDLLIKAFPLT